jgi:hypothetical protein
MAMCEKGREIKKKVYIHYYKHTKTSVFTTERGRRSMNVNVCCDIRGEGGDRRDMSQKGA